MTKQKTSVFLEDLIFSKPKMENHFRPEEIKEVQYTYAIVNGAGTDKVIMNLEAYDPENRILYYGDEAEELEEVAPWLVKLNHGESFSEWLFEECINKRLLLFIQSSEDIDSLADHLRFYTKAEVPSSNEESEDDHEIAYFSFYDPTIFSTWAKSLTKDEAILFFQPITNVWYEENNQLTLLYMAADGWKRLSHPLIEAGTNKKANQNIRESV